MVEWFLDMGISKELVVIITSALPILELRGALPIAINLFAMPWYWAFFLAVVGNMIPVPIILLCLGYFVKIISRIAIGEKLVNRVLERCKARSQPVQKYERIGLMIFVAIPLPFTGAWTGAIIAFLLGMKFYHAFLAIFGGVIIAGVIVTCLCLLGWIGAVIAGAGLCVLAALGLWKV
jgi:uncharacterized membrane protein